MITPTPENCTTCLGKGWKLLFNADSRALEIQRCDSCCRFGSDDDARVAVSADASTLVTALFEVCEALTNQTEHTVNPATSTKGKLSRELRTIRDSLRNALALKKTIGGKQTMQKKYLVGVREVHVRYYSVIADDPEQAKTLVDERAAAALDLEEQQYSHELDRDTWSVEETPHE